ncbi:hypothetical protein [Campylobacter hyointestinalis]|uniref:Uncharacterized protein n=1 Tax=Campylobacter hyointestinalis subsp. hyointestinalis TaxID=91352 RepID=A0A9W5AQX5_CAMHY|nr:hypothetical protein [Campylobacter hyointestinalis]CUU79274.1 Uncharacterised protein [Campylobacter hyointestinalis subsp. hyointestinalis]CUU90822.1 Uncharacterised protein [Campylobacter hyointestinalis subsp. hyointestinalis]
MKKIFIFMICVLFGIELYGGVWCNNDEGKSSVEQTNGTKNINSFGTDKEDIIELNSTAGTYKFKLIGDNINTQHGINHWDQLSLRIKTGFASKISVKITKVYEYNNRYFDTIKGETDIRNIWFKFIKSNVTNYDKKERGGLCFNRMLNNVEAGGYAKFENGIAYLPKNDTVNIIFEASNPQSDTYEKFKFEAEITVEPDDREFSLGENKFIVVNDQFQNDGDNKNLYTQIIKRPFNVKLITNFNRDSFAKDINSISITLHSKKSGDALNDAIEKIDLSKDDINNLNNKKDDSLKIINLDNKFSIDNSKKKSIDYSNLYFMVRINSENPFKSDTFAARPAKFNKRASFNKKDSLIGGKKYYPQTGDKNDFVLVEALDDKGNVINDYNVILENQRLEFDRSANRTKNEDEFCTYYYDENGIKTLQKIEPKSLENVWIKFSEGIGTIYTKCEDDLGNEKEFSQDNINNKFCYFVYPDIGHTKISITDNKTTIIDKEQNDCVSGSSSNTIENGKIGCNVQLEEVGFHTFIPSSINFVSRDILNYYDNYDENHIGLTYLSKNSESYALSKMEYEVSMAATLNLSVEARLADGTLPKLYSKNCYAKSIKFSLKDKKLDSRDIKFYGLNPENRDENASIAIKFPTDKTPEDNDKVFWIDENTFLEGKSLTQVKMSIDKKDEVVDKEGRNPIIVKTSDIIIEDANEFSGDISKVKNLEDIKNLIRNDQTAINVVDIKNYNDKTGNFFYGLLIIPDVSTYAIYPKNVFRQKEELRTSGNKAIATAYYSVFCDDECINGVVASEEDKETYKNIIIKTIGEMDDRSNVPGNQGFYISKFVDDNIIKTKYKSEDNNVYVVISEIDDKETKDGWGQVELTYNPTAIVWKKIKFIPYLVKKDGKETDTIATWLYPIEDTSTKDTFDVEFAPNAVWFGTGSAGQVMGIGKDYNGNSTNDEQKGKRQQRIDW